MSNKNSSSLSDASDLSSASKISYDLTKFFLESILTNNTKSKSVCLLGSFKDISETEQAIIILEKTAFTKENVENDSEQSYFNALSKFKETFVNDIYGNFQCFPNPAINTVKTTIIYPATKKHIQKYSTQNIHIIQETHTDYKEFTLPHLLQEQFTLDWVYNILEHKQETDRIIFEDPAKDTGFILLPDLKWDGKTVETLYLIAICHRYNIKSLRDLTAAELPLLRNIRDKGIQAIDEKYGVKRSQLRIYFHYQPSFYHLHVHFTYIKSDTPGIFCEKSHLLDTVINNIELMPDYYQRAILSFVVREQDSLYEKYNNKKCAIKQQQSQDKEQEQQNEETENCEPTAKKICLSA